MQELSDRFTGIKIYVYNQQTEEFEEIEHDVSYGIDARERKTMIVLAVVPEKIKNITVEKIKYYMESYADGYYNKNPVVEALIN